MLGDFRQATRRQQKTFEALGLGPVVSGTALDLGAGTGLQAIPLARLGYRVKAIDLSRHLLDVLLMEADALPITCICDDLLHFEKHLVEPPDLIVCMGDTLTHLESYEAVQLLLQRMANAVAPKGKLILSFRDYTRITLEGTSRFIPVRSDTDRILTACLEYKTDFVHVTDLLYERIDDAWSMRASSYQKLRLRPETICDRLQRLGFEVAQSEMKKGFVLLSAERG